MKKSVRSVEFESMLLGRHLNFVTGGSRDDGAGLDRSAYTLLSRMRITGPMSIGDLSEAFGLDPSTLNRQTSAMLRAGLVKRIPDPDGGIARKFQITDEGEDRLDAEREASVRALDKVFRDWTPEEVTAFAAALRRYNSDIESLSGRPWPRP